MAPIFLDAIYLMDTWAEQVLRDDHGATAIELRPPVMEAREWCFGGPPYKSWGRPSESTPQKAVKQTREVWGG